MNTLMDMLSDDLTGRYALYLETFLVDLVTDDENMEFRCGFSLRSDHQLRQVTLKLPTDLGEGAPAEAVLEAIFEQIEEILDDAIAEDKMAAN